MEIATRLLFRNAGATPLGRITLAGYIRESEGVSFAPMRRLGSYALVYLLEGSGRYDDAAGRSVAVSAGDCLVLLPEVAHGYGPDAGERWSEFHIVFDGPAFDLLRDVGVFGDIPVRRLLPVGRWLPQLEAALASERADTLAERTAGIARFVALLTELLLSEPTAADSSWVAAACRLLERDLAEDCDLAAVAASLGMSYESFRKQFGRAVGVPPARYRAVRRIDAACVLLHRPEQTLRSIAATLGFADEYHLSRRFTQIVGKTPSEFRRSMPR